MRKSPALLPVLIPLALGTFSQATTTIASASFTNPGNTEGWDAAPGGKVASGVADSAFIHSPVLAATVEDGAPAGTTVRPFITFDAVTLDEPDEFIEIRFKVRLNGNLNADRRFQASFWDSTSQHGYVTYVRAGTSSLTSQFVKQTTMPASGVMNTGGATIEGTTGDTGLSLGTSTSRVREVVHRVRKTEDGVELFFSCDDDAGIRRSITVVDTDEPLLTFDRFDTVVWGNTVPLNIDDVTVTTGIYVPPPADAHWDGGGEDHLWTTPANWADDTAPSPGSPLVFGAADTYDSENDFPASTPFGDVIFTPGAGFYEITGNPVALGGRLTNASTSSQVLNLPVELTGDLSVEAPGASLFLDGPISGDHGIIKTGSQAVVLAGANTFSGLVSVQQGRLDLENDQTGLTGGFAVSNSVASVLGISAGASVSVPEGSQILLGTTTNGIQVATLDVHGTVTNAGELQTLRNGEVHVNFGAVFTQTGPMRVEGVGGYPAKLSVHSGGEFIYAGNTDIQVNGAQTNFGPASIHIDGGIFSTNRGFENVTPDTTTTATGVILSNGGTLRLTADVSDLATTAPGTNFLFEIRDGGGTVDTGIHTVTLDLPLGGSGTFTKTGTGTLTCGAVNTHTGDTVVAQGTLRLTHPCLADHATVTVEENATLHLDFHGTDRVGSLVIGGETMPPGTYGASHGSGLITGPGAITVGVSDPFEDWISSFAEAIAPEDLAKDADPDGDGWDNLTEFAFDSDPTHPAPSGKIVHFIADGHLTIVLPVRDGATFTGTGPLEAVIDGIRYRVEGSADLSNFTANIAEVASIPGDLPPLSDGWTYRSFRLSPPVISAPSGFLRAEVTTP